MPKDFESESMLRVLQQIQQLMEGLDVKSLKGLQEPDPAAAPDQEPTDEGVEEMTKGMEGDPDSDEAKLLALKRQENGG